MKKVMLIFFIIVVNIAFIYSQTNILLLNKEDNSTKELDLLKVISI